MIRRIASVAITLVILASLVVGASLWMAATKRHSQASAVVEIQPGSSVKAIATALSDAGVIGAPRLFEFMVRVKLVGGKLKAGEYEFPAGTTLVSALDKIMRGDVLQYPVAVIEGYSIHDIGALLDSRPFLNTTKVSSDFLKLASDPAYSTQQVGSEVKSLEGYLFPDTYFLTKPFSADVLIRRMIARYKDVRGSLGAATGDAKSMSDKDLLTLASIVEKETGSGGERPLVASVFYNRLNQHMPLQSDPTIIYGLPNFDGNIRKSDITNPHPYNTYVHAGLPPGPICNPGKASLDAVLHPASSDYLYFVAKGNGTHQFSRTLAEHNEAVRKYQLSRQ